MRSQDTGTLPRSWTIEALEYGIVASNTVLEARGTDNNQPSAFAFNIHEISFGVKDIGYKGIFKLCLKALDYMKDNSKSWAYVLQVDSMTEIPDCTMRTTIASTGGARTETILIICFPSPVRHDRE